MSLFRFLGYMVRRLLGSLFEDWRWNHSFVLLLENHRNSNRSVACCYRALSWYLAGLSGAIMICGVAMLSLGKADVTAT